MVLGLLAIPQTDAAGGRGRGGPGGCRGEGKERNLGKVTEAGIIDAETEGTQGTLSQVPLPKGHDWPKATQQVCEAGTPDSPRLLPWLPLQLIRAKSLPKHA